MLLYLSGHSRPDITYPVNCAARYMFCAQRSHEESLVVNPVCDSNGVADVLQIDNYSDADFAGMYGYEKPTDPTCAKSRTGFTITVAACPVL